MNENSGDTYGECRCCLAVGHHRDIQKVYLLNGVREVYYEIFVKCFNLNLSTNMSLTPLICMNCVDRLRDAASFRDMAASTEKQLLSALSSAGKKSTVFVNVEELRSSTSIDVKEESQIKLEPDDFVLDLDSLDDYEADVIEDGKTNEDLVPGEADLVARFAHVSPLPTPGDLVTVVPEYARHLTMLKEFTVPANRILELLREHKIEMDHHSSPQKLYVTEKFAHMVNITTLLEHSNITPFKSKSRCGFPCLYCRAICENLDKLRVHTAQHKKAELSKILRRYGAECLVVYADITDLRCSLCESNIRTLNDLKSHLINTHKKKIYTEFTDRIIPYKLGNENGYECQLCGFTFETFGSIERHMNVHFRNYICKECGSGFVTKYRLKVHGKSMHADGSYPCESCGKIFNTLQKYKNHVNSVHKMMKRFKCTKCPERFSEYFKRQKHMVQIHGVAPLQYRCNVCDKCFDRKYTLSRHMKRDHLEERDFQCEVCPYKCFTKNELQIHMIKHNGERIYECSVCKKSYARKKTLKEHMRIHNNDRRFSCAVCGQAFVQKCSLKGHLKTHHLEYNLQ